MLVALARQPVFACAMANEMMEGHRVRRGAQLRPFQCSTSCMSNVVSPDRHGWQVPVCFSGETVQLRAIASMTALERLKPRDDLNGCDQGFSRSGLGRPKFVGSRERFRHSSGDTVRSVRRRRTERQAIAMSCPSQVLQSSTNVRLNDTVGVTEGESTGLKVRDSLYPTSFRPKPEGSNES